MRNSFSFSQNKNPKTPVDVLFYYSGSDDYARPVSVRWNDEEYNLGTVQFWHTEHRKGVLVHHYTVSDAVGDLTFELSMETDNLTWRLERVVSQDAS
ncbi:hypothetical protein KC867_03055, partial [Candidatus Saccharibacteria bacterium]|nr:hypothetical protein [Candidatus Saccharibacteria bacterium]